MKQFKRHAVPKRRHTVVFRLTDAEHATLQKFATTAGLTANELARALARTPNKQIVFNTVQQADPQLIVELKAIGNNLNQLAKHASLYGEIPEDLRTACDTVLTILQRVMQEV